MGDWALQFHSLLLSSSLLALSHCCFFSLQDRYWRSFAFGFWRCCYCLRMLVFIIGFLNVFIIYEVLEHLLPLHNCFWLLCLRYIKLFYVFIKHEALKLLVCCSFDFGFWFLIFSFWLHCYWLRVHVSSINFLYVFIMCEALNLFQVICSRSRKHFHFICLRSKKHFWFIFLKSISMFSCVHQFEAPRLLVLLLDFFWLTYNICVNY
jgi:hypothetical protein